MQDKKLLGIPRLRKRKIKPKKLVNKEDLTDEVVELITRISEEHSSNIFGYLEIEDLRSEIWIICLEALSEFDINTGKLENFLRASVKNRLINRFKEITKSVRPPCLRCEHACKNKPDTDCSLVKNAGTMARPTKFRMACQKWNKYELSVSSRNSLLNSTEYVQEEYHSNCPLNISANKELVEKLKSKISDQEMLNDIQKLMDGISIDNKSMQKLKEKAMQILDEDFEG